MEMKKVTTINKVGAERLYPNKDKVAEMLDKPLREVIKECNTVYVNPTGINLGILFTNGKVVRNVRSLELKASTRDCNSCTWETINIESATMRPVELQEIEKVFADKGEI